MTLTRRQLLSASLAIPASARASRGKSSPNLDPGKSSPNLDPGKPLRRLTFGSCAADWVAQPIWQTILETSPDLHLQLGDSIYADYDGQSLTPVTPATLEKKWLRFGARPEVRALRSKVPTLAIWDNHDYGSYAQGASFSLRRQSQEIFLNFWQEPPGSSRRATDGIYTSKLLGPPGKRVQLILLDTRFFKSDPLPNPLSPSDSASQADVSRFLPSSSVDKTVLGEQQWAWLARQLDAAAEVRIIASSTQVLADEKGLDEWGNFPSERERLLDLLQEKAAGSALFLSGNVHFGELTQEVWRGAHWLDFTSSGLTPKNINCRYTRAPNSKRLAGPYCGVNFGMIEFDWDISGCPRVTLKLKDVNGDSVFEHVAYFCATAGGVTGG